MNSSSKDLNRNGLLRSLRKGAKASKAEMYILGASSRKDGLRPRKGAKAAKPKR